MRELRPPSAGSHRYARWAVLLAFATVTAAACSDGGSDEKEARQSTTSASEATTSSTALPTPSPAPVPTMTTNATTALAAPTATTQAPTTTTAAVAPSTVAIAIKGFIFQPGDITVKPGTTIRWTNEDEILHTATSGAPPGTADNRFNGEMDGKGKSFSVKLDQPGTYEYFCSRHNSMTGRITVAT